jgi:hypothetical protein
MTEKTEKIDNQKRICIATPMYGGNAKTEYITSLSDLVYELASRGWSVIQLQIGNESLITRARNSLVHNFMKMDNMTGLLFIDSDHGFIAKQMADMVESGKDLIGGIYPMKGINWDGVRKAALLGKTNLELYSGSFAVNLLPEEQEFFSDKVFRVRDVGTGAMYISRKVFEELKPSCKTYSANSAGTDVGFGEEVVEYFKTEIHEVDEANILLSEDYAFCKMWRDAGNDVWAAPWVRMSHVGSYAFSGSFLHAVELAQVKDTED